MALPPVSEADNLVKFINMKQHQLDFFQLMRLISHLLKKTSPELSWRESFDQSVRIRPALSLDFPGREIETVEFTEDNKIMVETSFFGLYGVTSPLPNFYTEDLISAKKDGQNLTRLFFDLFHYAMYPLLLSAMTRFKPMTGLQEYSDRRQNLRRLSWLGLSSPKITEQFSEWPKMLKVASILSTSYCSVAGLKALLLTIVDSGSVNIVSCPTVRAVIPQRFRLRLGTRANQLGTQAVLGHAITAPNNNYVDIQLQDQTSEDIQAIMPGGAKYQLLKQALTLYVPSYLKLCLKMRARTQSNQVSQIRLGYGLSLGTQERSQNLAYYIA